MTIYMDTRSELFNTAHTSTSCVSPPLLEADALQVKTTFSFHPHA